MRHADSTENSTEIFRLWSPKTSSTYLGQRFSAAADWIIQQWDQEEYTRGGYNTEFPPEMLTKYGPYIATPFRAFILLEWRYHSFGEVTWMGQ
jgi:hypothetical protein